LNPHFEPSAGDMEIRESGSSKLTFMLQLDAQESFWESGDQDHTAFAASS
jgi:hypothetical protein